jgi:CxxC motif-containing protein (DUF1111 family)
MYGTRRGASAFGQPREFSAELVSLALVVGALCIACEAPPEEIQSPVSRSAAALDGISDDELSRFREGAQEFGETESLAEGLGPFFNGSACGHCHFEGGLGGGGVMRVTRVMCQTSRAELETPPSGSVLHGFSTRPDIAAPRIPAGCDPVLAERRTTNLLGTGLIEAIADDEILAEETTQRGGMSGRAAIVVDVASRRDRVGRFGWKAQHATLDSFAADAYRNELGITNELFPEEVLPNGDVELLRLMDPVPDPEARVGVVGTLADFMRFSREPAATGVDTPGLATFRRIGCAGCHRESYPATSSSAAIDGREVRLFSDLLLHDVGTGDGIPQAAALGTELRTPPLWGLGLASLFLHDGRTGSIEGAVLAHGGQAAEARAAFAALPDAERAELLEFLAAL